VHALPRVIMLLPLFLEVIGHPLVKGQLQLVINANYQLRAEW
jgi:hypothetical protein